MDGVLVSGMDDLAKALLPTFVEYGIPLLVTVIAGLGARALEAARRYFNNAAADRLLNNLERAASLAVHEVEQTIVPQIKRAAADGQFTVKELSGIRKATELRVRQTMGSNAMAELGQTMKDDLHKVLTTAIEAKVREMRISMIPRAPSVPVPPVIPKD